VARYEPWAASRGAEIIAEHAGREGAALPILHALQDVFGYVPQAAIPQIAQVLNLTRAEVHGIVTFYHDFRREAPGRHVLRLCRAESCQAMGADRLAEQTKARLGIDWHETTSDGSVTLLPVFCLGLCAVSPAALLDDRPIGRVDAAKLEKALGDAS
jgi:formate dehydrogenase subunit gamma